MDYVNEGPQRKKIQLSVCMSIELIEHKCMFRSCVCSFIEWIPRE